jgi:hypothetical protein
MNHAIKRFRTKHLIMEDHLIAFLFLDTRTVIAKKTKIPKIFISKNITASFVVNIANLISILQK